MRRQGYLPERDLVFATALVVAAGDLDRRAPEDALKSHLAKLYKRSLKMADGRNDALTRLRNARQAELVFEEAQGATPEAPQPLSGHATAQTITPLTARASTGVTTATHAATSTVLNRVWG